MRSRLSLRRPPVATTALAATLLLAGGWAAHAGGWLGAPKNLNPCAAKTINPCAAKTLNPCAAKTLNPCGANPCNPCGGAKVDPDRVRQPAGSPLAGGRQRDLVAEGERIWNDRLLGKSGLACSNCHVNNYGQMQVTFAKPYPHHVAMPAQQAGLDQVSAAEMVQFCMIVPMMSEPLSWNSRELAALTAYVEHIQAGYDPALAGAPAQANPCAMKRNPCNPCAGKRNPCNP
jgi:cytochrome c